METTQAKQEMGRLLSGFQARLDALETGARDRLLEALEAGKHRLGALDEALARVARDGWSADNMRRRLNVFRARAEQLRADTLRRMSEMPATAVTALANGTRVPVQNLARELERLSKLVEPSPEPRKGSEAVHRLPPEPKPVRPRQKTEAPKPVEAPPVDG